MRRQDPRGGRKPGRAEGRDRDEIRRRRRNQRSADCRGPARRHRPAASGRAIGRRRLRDRGTVQDRPEPDYRRNPAGEGRAGHRRLCGNAQSLRRAAGAGVGGVRRHAAGGDQPAARQRRAGALPIRATRRPGIAALCARRACGGAADHAGLGRLTARPGTMPSSPRSRFSSSPAPVRWDWRSRRCRPWHPAPCSGPACCSIPATPSSGWPTSTASCSTRRER